MKKRNNFIIIMVSLIMMINCVLVASAKEIDVEIDSREGAVIQPMYQDVCHGLPYHSVRAHGWCTVYRNGKIYINNGCMWKCDYCNDVLVTEGDKYYYGTDPIGKYASYTLKEGESLTHINYILNASYYGYTKDKELPTYKRIYK